MLPPAERQISPDELEAVGERVLRELSTDGL
jgi:hypothetical protein